MGPGVNIVGHHLDSVAADVVVEAAGDGTDAVVSNLVRVKIFPLYDRLQSLWNDEIAAQAKPVLGFVS
ncbi:MAG: hypothetical protein LC775_20340, partial [Acidobacteria bacterium]|nr:hypothetical protein [Acidobacteriota bacterium]